MGKTHPETQNRKLEFFKFEPVFNDLSKVIIGVMKNEQSGMIYFSLRPILRVTRGTVTSASNKMFKGNFSWTGEGICTYKPIVQRM